MNEERLEKLFPVIEKMVMWDEPKDKALKKATVNGCTEEEAEELYRRARAERIKHLRIGSISKAFQGFLCLLLMLAGITILARSGVVPRFVLVLTAIGSSLGLVRFLQGIGIWFSAPGKKGPVE